MTPTLLDLRRATLEACGWRAAETDSAYAGYGWTPEQVNSKPPQWYIATVVELPKVEQSLDMFTAHIQPVIEAKGLVQQWAIKIDHLVNWDEATDRPVEPISLHWSHYRLLTAPASLRCLAFLLATRAIAEAQDEAKGEYES